MNPALDIQLDLEFVRSQFPAFSEPSLEGWSFFENAGGSYVCKQVIDRLSDYYRRTKVQPYFPYPASERAGEAMDASYRSFAAYLNVTPDEVHFGPSTTQNTYVLARAMLGTLRAGDEIIVTDQDHEANGGAWRRLAEHGMVIREWQVDPETARLETEGLKALLSDKTRLVTFPHCSNIVGEINPVTEWARLAHEAGALVVADGVSYAGHGFPDVNALSCDIYLFSLYKTYGPHQGVMVVRDAAMEGLTNQSHYFNDSAIHKRLIPAGPDPAQVAAARGVTDYFDAVFEHHFGGEGENGERARRVHDLFRSVEKARLAPLLNFLEHHPKIRIIGPTDPENRAPTVSVLAEGISPPDLVKALAEHNIMSGYGHFYAARLAEALGLDLATGVTRFSFVHYTSEEDIKGLMGGLEKVL